MLMSSPWRLSLLFLVSGIATGFLLSKQDAGFLRTRSSRLLIPLLFGMLVIVAPQTYYEVVQKAGFDQGWAAFYRLYLAGDLCRGDECLITPTWNHLWFVAYLWVYTCVLCVLLRFASRFMCWMDRLAADRLSGLGILIWPLLWLFMARVLLVGRFESTHALIDDWYNHAQYLPVFLLGFLIARADRVWDALERLRWPALLLAIGAWVYIAWYFATYRDAPPPELLRLLQRALWALQQWCAILAVLGFARRLRPSSSPALRYLSEAVFPIYILHQTLIIVIAWQLQPLGLNPAVEAPVLVLATLAGCFAGFELVRRINLLRPLFGLKRRPVATRTSSSADAELDVRPAR